MSRQCFRLIDGRTMWRYMARRRGLIPEKQDLYFEIKCQVTKIDSQDFFLKVDIYFITLSHLVNDKAELGLGLV